MMGGSELGDGTPVVNDNGTTSYIEYSGNIAPGTYSMSATYGATSVSFQVVVNQDADQDPVVTLPGNLNFTIPVCEGELLTTFAVQISDDCDDPIAEANASFLLGGNAITPTLALGGYFEFAETLTPDNNGDLLEVSYTDGAGNETIVDGLITVTDQPDNWAPHHHLSSE